MRATSSPRQPRRFPALAAVALVLGMGAAAAQAPATRIAVVDTQRIINESELFAAGRQKLTEEFAARDQALLLEEARLRELDARREREASVLADAEAQALRRESEALGRSIARRRNELKAALNRRINELTETIDRRIQEEIGAYAREQGYELVLTDNVGFVHPRLDITDAILQRVNAHAGELRQP
ncbi:MAG: OmpH family outer membrane protein [Xanthomonadales bacterium]|nr:hypothetical protein [Xanthomonadales bacterium]MCC6593763.1 OmpH family outer membrane protein [Xanthomonadales bacterium]MCE7930204.1 OmpH family outer membrane protein [Xanthomonadales bacterium PRO6]